MNQRFDEPMDRVSVCIPKKDHIWIKNFAIFNKLKKGEVLRNYILFGMNTDKLTIEVSNDGSGQISEIRERAGDIEG